MHKQTLAGLATPIVRDATRPGRYGAFCTLFCVHPDCCVTACFLPGSRFDRPLNFNTQADFGLLDPVGAPEVFDLHASMDEGVGLMLGTEGWRSFNTRLNYHITLNYLCCHTAEERQTIIRVIDELEWEPIPVTVAGTGCNKAPTDQWAWIWGEADAASEAALLGLVRRIEDAIEAEGITVNRRVQTMHATLGTVRAEFVCHADHQPFGACLTRVLCLLYLCRAGLIDTPLTRWFAESTTPSRSTTKSPSWYVLHRKDPPKSTH